VPLSLSILQDLVAKAGHAPTFLYAPFSLMPAMLDDEGIESAIRLALMTLHV
jgi:hypothetical protein